MIDLTRLNGSRLLINPDLIKFAEASPDTTLTLTSAEKIVVRESCDELIERILLWRSGLLRSTWPEASSLLSGLTSHL